MRVSRVIDVDHKTSELVSAAVVKKLKPIRDRVKTINFYNGKTFEEHVIICKPCRKYHILCRSLKQLEKKEQ